MYEHASDLRGFLVVSREEGALLGVISGVHVDPQSRAISAFTYRRRRTAREHYFVPINAVQLVGRDIVLVATENAAVAVTKAVQPPGKSLEALQGCWVTTLDGTHLGTLVDIDFSTTDWTVSELMLAEDKRLPVVAADISIGDEILVPASYVDHLESHAGERPGLLRRTFGNDIVEGTANALKRALRRRPASAEDRPDE